MRKISQQETVWAKILEPFFEPLKTAMRLVAVWLGHLGSAFGKPLKQVFQSHGESKWFKLKRPKTIKVLFFHWNQDLYVCVKKRWIPSSAAAKREPREGNTFTLSIDTLGGKKSQTVGKSLVLSRALECLQLASIPMWEWDCAEDRWTCGSAWNCVFHRFTVVWKIAGCAYGRGVLPI